MHKVSVQQEAVAEATHAGPTAEAPRVRANVRFATLRRSSSTFFIDFRAFMEALEIHEVVSMAQSESEGFVTFTIAYR